MEVDFNNLRLQTAHAYNGIIRTINDHIDNGAINIDLLLIEKDIKDLRSCIHILLCCYQPDDDSARSLVDEVELEIFNKENLYNEQD